MKAGRALLTTIAALTAAAGFIADMNKTHMFNPRWTPHAKYHDAMTILLASMLGTSGTYLLHKKGGNQKFQLALGTILPGFFWTAMAGSFAFPGAKGLEAEFPDKVKKLGSLRLNEGFASAVMLALLATGLVIETKRLRVEK